MYSRPFLLITCLPVLWLCFFAVAADAQESNGDPVRNLENIGSEVSYLRNQAARGDAMANYQLGHLYMTGTGVSVNYAEAAKFLHAAAEQGLPEAEVVLGYLYEHGKGVPRDYRKAFELLHCGGEEGKPNSSEQSCRSCMSTDTAYERIYAKRGLVSLRRRARKSNSAVQPGLTVFPRKRHHPKLCTGSRMVSEGGREWICAWSTDPCVDVFQRERCTSGLRNGGALACN